MLGGYPGRVMHYALKSIWGTIRYRQPLREECSSCGQMAWVEEIMLNSEGWCDACYMGAIEGAVSAARAARKRQDLRDWLDGVLSGARPPRP
jgi:hypothetical protein